MLCTRAQNRDRHRLLEQTVPVPSSTVLQEGQGSGTSKQALPTPHTRIACQVSELPRPPRADEAGGSLRSLAHPTARCLEMSLDQPNIQTPQAFHHTASSCPSASSFSKHRTKQRVLTPLSQLAYGLPNPLCWNRLEQLSSQNHDHAYPLRNRPRSLEAIPHGLG